MFPSHDQKGMPMKGMPMHSGAPHMESAKQERKNLMDDNPVTRTAAGDRPWIAKHYKSGINYGSPAQDAGHGKKFTDEHFPSGKHRSDIKMDHK